ncbi:hypothetical protein DFQ26_003997 [Actinomortierella ambigua]|nr:hypothetical protein DFQ26_003997 [Actinomortierella ambigua]
MPPGFTNATICSNLNTVTDLWIAGALPNTSIAFLRNRDQVTVAGSLNGTGGYQGQGSCVVSNVNGQTIIGYASTESYAGLFILDASGGLTEQKAFKGKRQQRVDNPSLLAIGAVRNDTLNLYAYSRKDGNIKIGGDSGTVPLPPAPGVTVDMAVDGLGNLWYLDDKNALHLFVPQDPFKSADNGSWLPVSSPVPGAIQLVSTNSGVAVIVQDTHGYSSLNARATPINTTSTITLDQPTPVAPAPVAETMTPIFGFVDSSVVALSKTSLTPLAAPPPQESDLPGEPLPQPPPPPHDSDSSSSQGGLSMGAIIGIVVVGVCLVMLAVVLVIRHRQRRQGGKVRGKKISAFGGFKQKKQARDLFPPPQRDDMATAPLGLYADHRHTEASRSTGDNNDAGGYNMNLLAPFSSIPPSQQQQSGPLGTQQQDQGSYNSGRSMGSRLSNLDDQIPLTARMQHQDYSQTAAHHHLPHAVSVSAMAPQFARTNAQSGLRFEEKVQLQVICYEDSDAVSTSPHQPVGSLVLGAYCLVRPARSARPLKVLEDDGSGLPLGVVRSGTVFVRKSRLWSDGGLSSSRLLPTAMMGLHGEDSSMLLTEVENQHTSEVQTLKWYMTEVHWKREAALLKHLKSPIFIMELMASYCIPALQYRPSTFPFVNAMGGCSRLLSNLAHVRTPQHARSILRSASAAVDWCHQRGVVHLNIQPASFFIEDGIDPTAEDASWKLWDFTCARFIGEQIGVIGGGGSADALGKRTSQLPLPAPPSGSSDRTNNNNYGGYGGGFKSPVDDRLFEQQQQLISGNPLPGCYTAPELLETWREGRTEMLAEASMDSWSLGCLYFEILAGSPLFRTEAEAWALVGGWDNSGPRRLDEFRVPFPATTRSNSPSNSTLVGSGHVPRSSPLSSSTLSSSPLSSALDPSGAIGQLMHDLLAVQPAKRLTLAMTMERIY